ncbi:DNA cytosine methyltransferase [Marinilactibacillus kalidii]|uniref:DNA cytosine methyltransferase n=1 Tax=Marinilactibacillus kalidii TaxID=2820274 RepID=UPI001ABE0377|nr:DNA cytosine methyltransferase [Marinilactibacillus kalidii]
MTENPTIIERKKFKPTPNYSQEDVKDILAEKIKEETQQIIDEPDSYKVEDLYYKKDKANIVSLFCGAGGLDLGVELAGLDVEVGKEATNQAYKSKVEFDSIRENSIFHHLYSNDIFNEALDTYAMNFSKKVFLHNKNIKKVKEFPKNADIIVGGPPCPGYSAAGPRLVDDPRNFLYLHYIRALMQVKPKFFIMENVKGMLTLGKGEVFQQIKQDFEATGYRIYADLLNARDYGVPQSRERVFLIGVREDIDFEYEFPNPTHGDNILLKPYVTLYDSIGDLEENPGDYFTGSYSSIFMSRNRKKGWEDTSFTIQASGRQAPIHPGGVPMEKLDKNKWIFPDGESNNRRLSVKEIARIQTFPDWFTFCVGNTTKISKNGQIDKIYKQIGNAVPVELARAVAQPIAQWLIENK